MFNSIVFYGKRGLVNGLVLKLDGNLDLTKTFLKNIRFCGSAPPTWIESLQEVFFLVEPSFSEFGNPDLVMICNCKEKQKLTRHVVFLEAKIVKYDDSAVPLKESKAKDIQGINSRINAQLTLRFRLARVLKNRSKSDPVEETEQNWAAYAQYPTEGSKKPRKLLKSLGLKLCDDFMLEINDFWFVTLSADNYQVEPYHKPESRPLVLDFNGQNLWDELKDHFGLIVYDQLDCVLSPTGAYSKAREYFLPKAAPVVQADVKTPGLRTKIWDTFSPVIRSDVRESIRNIIENAVNTVFGPESDRVKKDPQKGSDSYKLDRRTLIKLVPKHTETGEKLILAVLTGVARAAGVAEQYFPEGPFMIGGGDNPREFLGRSFSECPDAKETSDYIWAIEMILKLAADQ
ncbi:MAG TPA: hypothetical protein DCK76_11770 [Desulfotomaculum sp.]|nr:MAG: Uncharacterized protein XD78_2266 [Desulfotomaculum sp. 46_296]HAG12016.1 hypothetical protein [Desulfotomaculum sp.]HBY04990.1 hypothetical protein [Desulfotomaculum sp.]